MSLLYGADSDLALLSSLGVTNPSFVVPAAQTTAVYSDARTLWQSKTRSWINSRFTHPISWDYTRGIDSTRLKEILNLGFYGVLVKSSVNLTSINVGVSSLGAYLQENTSVPVYTLPPQHLALDKTGSTSWWDCWLASGNHVGNGAICATEGADQGLFSSSAFRLRTGDTPRASSQVAANANPFLIPLWPNAPTIQLMKDLETFGHAKNGSNRGAVIVTALAGFNRVVSGYVVDWEDTYNELDTLAWTNGNTKTLFQADNRFGPDALYARAGVKLIKDGHGLSLEQRLLALDAIYPNVASENCSCYDLFCDVMETVQGIAKGSSAYGRVKGNFQNYAFNNNTGSASTHGLNWTLPVEAGKCLAINSARGVDLYSSWISSNGSSNPGEAADIPLAASLAVRDDPFANGHTNVLSIGQFIGLTRFQMATGSHMQHMFTTVNTASHPWYSFLVAIEEMQPLFSFIQFGKNYIPPAGRQRLAITGGLAQGTIFYDKDSVGSAISSNVWICCRVWNNKMMFFGITSDDTYTVVNVKAPNGQLVNVAAGQMGAVTVL